MYTLFFKNRMIQMHGLVSVPNENNQNLHDRFNKFEKLFDIIVNSFVLPEIYTQ